MLDWGLNLGPPTLEASTIPLGYRGGGKDGDFYIYIFFFVIVQLLSVLRGHSFFSSPPQRPMTSDFEGFSIPDFIQYIFFPILILEKEPVFSLLNVQC